VDHEPRKNDEELKIPRRRLYVIVGSSVLLLLFFAGVVLHQFFPQGKDAFFSSISRMKGILSYIVLGHKPGFYYIDIEKNGKDYRLTKGDALELTYRDEFVVKDVATDVVFGKGIDVDVEGIGAQNDFRVLLRGVDLVDRIVMSKGMRPDGEALPAGGIHIKYRDEMIASIPMRVIITPQDWLRYAKTSEDRQAQIEYLKKAIAMNSSDIGVRKMLAALFSHSGMMNKAIAQYQEILSLKPDDPGTLNELFNCHMKVKEYDQALKIGLRQIKLYPSEASPYVNVALAYSCSGDWGKAAENYKMALKIQPNDHAVRYGLAEAYEKTKNFDHAIGQYRNILTKASGDERAMAALAGASLKAGSYDESIKWYKEVIKKQPRNVSAHANIGLAYGGKGLWNEEIEYYKKAISLNPRDPVVQFNLAVAYEKRNLDREAALAYEKVLKMTPGDPDAIFRLANIEYKNKKYDRAIRLYEKIIKVTPQRASAHANLGFAYGELKKYRQSADNYEKAIKNGMNDPQIHYNLAYTYEKLGKSKESIAEYERYAARRPTIDVLNILAEHYVNEKQYNQTKDYTKINDLDQNKAAGYSNIAYVYGLKNDVNREIEYYKLSLQYDREDSQVYLNLGEAYEKKGLYEEALKAYSDAYGLNPDSAKAAKKIPQLRIRIIEKKHAE
jgi:tetratricopeptide (TPR) repeat protein